MNRSVSINGVPGFVTSILSVKISTIGPVPVTKKSPQFPGNSNCRQIGELIVAGHNVIKV